MNTHVLYGENALPDGVRSRLIEWRAGVCEKPRIKCSDCGNRLLIPLSDSVIYDHLAGEHAMRRPARRRTEVQTQSARAGKMPACCWNSSALK
jgi:hypothetical protein